VNNEQNGARRWIGRRWKLTSSGVDPRVREFIDPRSVVPGLDREFSRQLAAVGLQERRRLTQAARPALSTLLSAEPELEAVELDQERGATVLSFGNGARLRAAVDRSVHPTLERLARRLGGDPVYLSAAWLSAEGGVLLRMVCGAFWPIDVGPLVPAAG
jgi:hypothetical protein